MNTDGSPTNLDNPTAPAGTKSSPEGGTSGGIRPTIGMDGHAVVGPIVDGAAIVGSQSDQDVVTRASEEELDQSGWSWAIPVLPDE